MAMRFGISSSSRASVNRLMAGTNSRTPRYFSDGKGRILSEEERAAETIYIQKMERERLEKKRLQEEKAKGAAKNTAEKKAGEEAQKG